MLAAQAPREQRLAVADDVIQNDGDIANLRDQVEKLHRAVLVAAGRNRTESRHERGRHDESSRSVYGGRRARAE